MNNFITAEKVRKNAESCCGVIAESPPLEN